MVDWRAKGKRLKAFVIENFLPLAFAVAIVWALAWPVPGVAVISVTIMNGEVHLIQEINIIIVFFISGLVLKTEDIKTALRHKLGVAFGMVSILFVTPCLGFMMRAIPLDPSEFAAGLTLFSAVPTTLGIGVSLVRTCKGNEGLALLLTVASNLLGIFTMPVWMKALFHGSTLDVHVDIPNLLVKLLITILVPSVVGKALRELPPFSKHVQKFTKDWKTALSLFSVFNLAMIVWQSLSGARDALLEQQFVQILYVILLAIGQHLLYLACNFAVLEWVFHMPLVELIATGIMSSQKSAPVAVTVISYLSSDISQQGLLIIPCVVGQISQIFIGSALARVFARRVAKHKAAQQAQQGQQGELPGGAKGDPESGLQLADGSSTKGLDGKSVSGLDGKSIGGVEEGPDVEAAEEEASQELPSAKLSSSTASFGEVEGGAKASPPA